MEETTATDYDDPSIFLPARRPSYIDALVSRSAQTPTLLKGLVPNPQIQIPSRCSSGPSLWGARALCSP